MNSRRGSSRSGRPDDLRSRAEERDRGSTPPSHDDRETPSPGDALRLIHELRIHQIELEMQNEELRRAQEQVEASRARYFDLYDMAPVGYLTVNEQGRILEANLAAATLLGVERGILVGELLTRRVVPEDQALWDRNAERIFASGELVDWELRLARASGGRFWAHLEAISRPEPGAGESFCRLMISDITGRRRVEEALQESEERYRIIVESSRELIYFLDEGGGLRWHNQAFRELLGALPEGEDLFSRVHREDAQRVADAWRSEREGGASGAELGYRLRSADGGYRTLESRFRKIAFRGEALWCVVSRDTTELTSLRRRVAGGTAIAGIVGRDPKMLELSASIRELADADVPVLILGESGTGKELIASAIHREGPRAERNFVAINCGALPDTLLETELFGHVRGSFTGAHRDKKGRFELAHGGTIFLDEVGDLSPAMQVRLLRVLQEGTFEKVGAEQSCRVDVRVISATNRDLGREVAARRFREDLFYRLSVVPLAIPPLRERLSDIPLLVEHILDDEARRSDRRRDTARPPRKVAVAREALALLIAHRWPGNVRELQNVLRFALIKCKGNVLRPGHLPPAFLGTARKSLVAKGRKPKITDEMAEKALNKSGGHPGEAARSLGVSRATFYRHLPKRG